MLNLFLKSYNKLRLVLRVTNRHIYANFVSGDKTVFSVSTLSKDFDKKHFYANKDLAKSLGEFFVSKCPVSLKKYKIFFDRGDRVYTGVVATFADAVRSGGFDF